MNFRAGCVLLFLAAGACEKDPMAETGDLWPGYHRHATASLPTVKQVESACFKAEDYFNEQFERQQGAYVDRDPDYLSSAVRNLRCSWQQGAAVTAYCRFETSPIYYSDVGREDSLRRRRDVDWRKMEARLVHVGGPIPWIPPKGCTPAPPPAG